MSGSLVISVDANFTIQIRRGRPFNASLAQRFIEMMDMCSINQSKFPFGRGIDLERSMCSEKHAGKCSKAAWYPFETLRSKLKGSNDTSRLALSNDPNDNKSEGRAYRRRSRTRNKYHNTRSKQGSKEYKRPGIVAIRLLGHVGNRVIAKTIVLDSWGGSMSQFIRDIFLLAASSASSSSRSFFLSCSKLSSICLTFPGSDFFLMLSRCVSKSFTDFLT